MYINLNAPSAAGSQTDPNNLWISLSGDPAGNCVTTRITYLKFSLTGLAPGEVVDPALQLILTRSGATGNAPGHSVGLYQVANSWDESYPWNAAPLPGARIGALQPFPETNGAQVIFSGPALVSYVQSHANTDDVVSFAVQLVNAGACPAGVVSAVFDSREDTGGSAPVLTVKSPLETTPSPTPRRRAPHQVRHRETRPASRRVRRPETRQAPRLKSDAERYTCRDTGKPQGHLICVHFRTEILFAAADRDLRSR